MTDQTLLPDPNQTHEFVGRLDRPCLTCSRPDRAAVHRPRVESEGGAGNCVFCSIIEGYGPATVLANGKSSIVIEPLEPAVPGHALVIPRVHVTDAVTNPDVTATTFRDAFTYLGRRQGNVLTSVGPDATQTVMHLHVHVIPRHKHDGVHEDWPWHRALYDGIRRADRSAER